MWVHRCNRGALELRRLNYLYFLALLTLFLCSISLPSTLLPFFFNPEITTRYWYLAKSFPKIDRNYPDTWQPFFNSVSLIYSCFWKLCGKATFWKFGNNGQIILLWSSLYVEQPPKSSITCCFFGLHYALLRCNFRNIRCCLKPKSYG